MKEESTSGLRKAGSKVLLKISVLLLVVFIIFGVVSFLFFRRSQNKLIQRSKDQLVEYKVELIESAGNYIINTVSQIQKLTIPGTTSQSIQDDIAAGATNESVTPTQRIVNDLLQAMVKEGLFNYELVVFATTPGDGGETLIVNSSDDQYMYEQLAPELVELTSEVTGGLEDGNEVLERSYLMTEEGFPGLGLDGEYLVSAYKFKPESAERDFFYIGFTPMHDELAAIDSFYSEERNSINLTITLLQVGMSVLLIFLTYLFLWYLIRRKITRPIDELSMAAEQAMEGDIDVQVPVRPGEEFEGLKTVFNQMLGKLRAIISQSVEEGSAPAALSGTEDSSGAGGHRRRKRGRSTILFQVTAFVVVLFLIAGGLSLFLYQSSQSRLIEKSKERLIESEVEMTCSTHALFNDMVIQLTALLEPFIASPQGSAELIDSVKNREIGAASTAGNRILRGMIDEGLLDIVLAIEVLTPMPGVTDEELVVQSSDMQYNYMALPQELKDMLEFTEEDSTPYEGRIGSANTYKIFEDGVPELDLEGQYLVTAYEQTTFGVSFVFYDFKPISDKLASVDEFFDDESKNTLVVMSLVIGITVIAIVIIMFFVLSYLIRDGITKPIDELEAAAERVMAGDLNAEVNVRKGEEFEGIKTAFNEMLKSLRRIKDKT